MADIVTAIVDVLKADAGVAALAEDRVFGGELSPDQTALMPRAAIVVSASGGPAFHPASRTTTELQRLDVVCYGATLMRAVDLRDAAGRALRTVLRQEQSGVLIHWVQSAGGWLTGRDRDGAWPYAFQSFQSLFATDEVA